MFIDRRISTDGHIVHLAIEETCNGWDIREELDEATVHVEHHDDWHRVERAMLLLELAVLRHGVLGVTAHH